ncbi:hypothetical protein PG996_003033 [Apiospora saccharicola]|uniref:Uncharacterized protein n=1 Tax=Apiospora saccharicola TaxID=335842 RepID=A0ABR1W3Y6_9PEZI
MAGSSTQSVYDSPNHIPPFPYYSSVPSLTQNSATPRKPPTAITANTAPTLETEISRNNVQCFMYTKNSGGDPVTALGLRSDSASQSTAERLARVQREMTASLERYRNS